MNILVTGTAGFIGFHLTKALLQQNSANNNIDTIIALDSINDYYDTRLKYARLKELGFEGELPYNEIVTSTHTNKLLFIRLDMTDTEAIAKLFRAYSLDTICHLAAQAGVRHSLTHPEDYIQANLVGFFNIINNAKHNNTKRLVYASSSSVYGLNDTMPFKIEDKTDNPASLYAATKKSNELIAHTYSHLYGMQTIGLRFFTVYGPWGRPDMALFLFVKNILSGKRIDVYNYGKMARDFTYVDDIVKGIIASLFVDPQENYHIYNIGNNSPVQLMDFIQAIEQRLDKKATLNLLPIQPGDIPKSYADVSALIKDFDYCPKTPIQEGINCFIDWYLDFYR